VDFPGKDTENYTLEYLFQHMPGSLPDQSQKMYTSQPKLNNNWTPKKANTGSTKPPLPIATQLY
jgi:hypothetical protein